MCAFSELLVLSELDSDLKIASKRPHKFWVSPCYQKAFDTKLETDARIRKKTAVIDDLKAQGLTMKEIQAEGGAETLKFLKEHSRKIKEKNSPANLQPIPHEISWEIHGCSKGTFGQLRPPPF